MPNAPDAPGARGFWLGLGLVLVAIGFVGLFVPLLPTTDFLLLALPCFARSSPRLESWLRYHPRFGPTLRAWQETGAVPRHAKIAACFGMAAGFTMFCWFVRPPTWGAVSIGGLLLASCAWIARRPGSHDHVPPADG